MKNDESSQQKKSQAHHANGSENPKNGGKPSELRRKDEEAHQRIQESCKSLVEYKRVESSEDKILQTVGGSRRSREPCVCKDLSNSPKIRSVDPFSGILPSRTGERISQLDHFLIQSTPEIALKQKEGVKFPLTFADLVQWFEEPSFYGKSHARGLIFITFESFRSVSAVCLLADVTIGSDTTVWFGKRLQVSKSR